MQHWTLARDADGIAWLTFDKAGATANTLSAAVLAELNTALDMLDQEPPKGLVIRSGKANGFIAGADVEEFGDVHDDADALAIVKRGWDTFERLAKVAYPTLALVRGFCLGGGFELALACRYRVVVDEPGTRLGLPEVMLGIVPAWGGIKRLPKLIGAPAALDLLLTGKTIDARRARKLGIADECVPVRIMDATARGVLRALPPPRTLGFPLSLTLNPLARRFIAASAAKKVGERARREHYPAPYAVLDLWVKYDGDALAAPASDPASIPALFRSPTAANLLRVFRLQERLKGLGKEGAFARRTCTWWVRARWEAISLRGAHCAVSRSRCRTSRPSAWRRRCSGRESCSPKGCATHGVRATRLTVSFPMWPAMASRART
jgi:3-hydroxyacyl-CoA dehydrogenase/enoyl-CoA hydratase/3-hydroxybutyryl-CoA epimerase